MSVDPELVGGCGGAASISIAGAGTLGLDSVAGATGVFVLCTGGALPDLGFATTPTLGDFVVSMSSIIRVDFLLSPAWMAGALTPRLASSSCTVGLRDIVLNAFAGTTGLDSAADATSVFVPCAGVGGRGEAPATELVFDLGVDILH